MEFVIDLLLYALAIYGALMFLSLIFSSISGKSKDIGSKMKCILLVQNAEESIEYVTYCLIKRVILESSIPLSSIVIIDMDSNDDTKKILSKLRNEFSMLELIDKSDKAKVFEGF